MDDVRGEKDEATEAAGGFRRKKESMAATMKMKKTKSAKIKKRKRYFTAAVFLSLIFLLFCLTFLAGCTEENGEGDLSAQSSSVSAEETGGLKITGSMEISYASEFSVDYLDNGGRLIRISDGSVFLLLPEGASVPAGLSEEITVLQQPVSRIYLAAAAAMDHFCKIGATDAVALTEKRQSDWYIEEARNAVGGREDSLCGKVQYAGLRADSTAEMHSRGGIHNDFSYA